MQTGHSYIPQGRIRSYRFGFNGQEKDNEVYGEGNAYSFEYRVHDPRLGRFLSVDPLAKSYPHYTPYSFAGNKPIQAIDIEGAEELVVTAKGSKFYAKAMLLIMQSEHLQKLMNSISDPSKAATQKIYLTIGDLGSDDAQTTSYNIKPIAEQLVLYNNMSEEGLKRLSDDERIALFDNWNKYAGKFQNWGIDFNEVANSPQSEIYVIAVDQWQATLDEKTSMKNLAHEADAHMKKILSGNFKSANEDHYEYFDIKEGSPEARQHSMSSGYSPPVGAVKPNSRAGKNNAEVDKAYEKIKK